MEYSPSPWFYPDFAPFENPSDDERNVGFIVGLEMVRASKLETRPTHTDATFWSAYLTYRDYLALQHALPSWQGFRRWERLTPADMMGKLKVVERIKQDIEQIRSRHDPQ